MLWKHEWRGRSVFTQQKQPWLHFYLHWPSPTEELHNLYFTPVLVWSVPSCPGYKQGPPDLHSVAALLHQLHSHWSPPSEFGFPAEKDNRGFISCENPPLLTPGDNKPSCEIIKTESWRFQGIISYWFPHSETSQCELMRRSIIFNFPGPVCEKMFDLQVHFKAGSYGKRRLWSHQEEDKTRPRFCSYCVHICSRQPCPHRWQVCRSQIMRRGMGWTHFVHLQVRRFCTYGISDNEADGGLCEDILYRWEDLLLLQIRKRFGFQLC